MSITAMARGLFQKNPLSGEEKEEPEWDGRLPSEKKYTENEAEEQALFGEKQGDKVPEAAVLEEKTGSPLELDSSKEYAIIIENVVKQFGEERVLKNVSHAFEKGKVHGIIGNNGSGKTVMFKCICGFMQPTEGRILVRGKEIGRDVDFPEHIGIIIETPGFLAFKTGFRNLQILASLNNRIGREEIIRTIERVGLDPALKKTVSKYSLGMRQRLGIAQAIMEDPDLLILDEPFNGLDKHGVADIRNIIMELKEQGKTILLASHNAEDIRILCDTVCEMDAGILREVSGHEENEG
ncbi:MAG: ATP-binding cassette domain-containing protein [Bacteroides sp.]|nr:ATP-binding cassette domain-containing protein [Bacteroides sp.]